MKKPNHKKHKQEDLVLCCQRRSDTNPYWMCKKCLEFRNIVDGIFFPNIDFQYEYDLTEIEMQIYNLGVKTGERNQKTEFHRMFRELTGLMNWN